MAEEKQAAFGIIAGGGDLPLLLAQAIRARGQPVFIVMLADFADPALTKYPHIQVKLGKVKPLLAALREHNCQELALIGQVKRPSLRQLSLDTDGSRILAKLGKAFFTGDDGLLRKVIGLFEEEGFKIVDPSRILDDVVAPAGCLTEIKPDEQAFADAKRGVTVLNALDRADVGQACIVQEGIVLAVEAAEGTDALLQRSALLKHEGPGSVLIKKSKATQDLRADLPTLGGETVRIAAQSGVRGIFFEAGKVFLPKKEEMIALADEKGLFLQGFDFTDL